MSEIKVDGHFNLDACDGCRVKSDCSAYKFANSLRIPLIEDSKALQRDMSKVISNLAHINEGGQNGAAEQFEIATNRFAGLLNRSEQLQLLTTAVVVLAVKAQIQPNAEQRLDDLTVALATIVPSQRLHVNSLPDRDELDKIGCDARYHATTGVCGAIGIEEPR